MFSMGLIAQRGFPETGSRVVPFYGDFPRLPYNKTPYPACEFQPHAKRRRICCTAFD